MTILDRMNLRPMPVFDVADKGAGDGADKGGDKGAADKGTKSALDAGADGDADADKGSDKGAADKGGEQDQRAATLPENWRDFFADDDDGKKELGRFKSPKEVTKALLEQKKKLRQGIDPSEAAPEDAEQLKVWREARGIPEKSADYKIPDTVKADIKDVDKPIVDGYMEFMHKRNATQAQIGAGLEFFFGMEKATAADRAEADTVQMKETTSTLKEMWGADFKANSQIAKRAAGELISDVNLFDARLPDGRKIGNVPEFGDLLVQLGLMKWGEGAYEGGKGGSDGVGDELADLKKQMGNIKTWRTNKAGQARYMELMEQKEKRGGR